MTINSVPSALQYLRQSKYPRNHHDNQQLGQIQIAYVEKLANSMASQNPDNRRNSDSGSVHIDADHSAGFGRGS